MRPVRGGGQRHAARSVHGAIDGAGEAEHKERNRRAGDDLVGAQPHREQGEQRRDQQSRHGARCKATRYADRARRDRRAERPRDD